MPIRNQTTRNHLAERYAAFGPNLAAFTADPGTADAATTEVTTTGSPAYARKAITGAWATPVATSSAISGSATLDIPAGTTVTHLGVCAGLTRGTADVRDSFDSVDQTFSSQGTYAVTPTYTQS